MKGVSDMKKRDLWTGVGMTAAGILFLLAALLWDTPLDSLLCGFCGAFTVPGIAQIVKYVKWTKPENVPVCRERLEQERINLRDERKAMLRDKSGRYAYVLGLLIAAAAVLVFAALEMLGVIGKAEGRFMTLFLSSYLVVQYIAGLVFYRMLEKKF